MPHTPQGGATSQRRRWPVFIGLLALVLGLTAHGVTPGFQAEPARAPHVGPVATPCRGVSVSPGSEVEAVVSAGAAGTTYCLEPGLYRLTRPIVPKTGDTLIGQPGTILSGARLIAAWTRSGRAWVARGQTQQSPPSWRPNWPPIGNPAAQYNEDVFLDGRPLRRVLSAAAVGPGTFYFDYADEAIYLGDDPAGHVVEGSATTSAVESPAGRVTVRNLTVEKFTTHGIAGGRGSVVANNEVRYVHQAGIRFVGESRVVANYVHHIGALGLTGSGDDVVVEGNEVAFNNAADYRTVAGGCWTAGGSKWVLTRRLVVRNNYTHDNFCDGFWSDIDNIDTLYEGNRVENNDRAGLFVEISYATTIRGNTIAGNRAAGIIVNSSSDQTIAGNTIWANGTGMPASGVPIPPRSRGGVVIVQQRRGSGRFGPHLAQNITVRGNIIGMTAGATGAAGDPEVFRRGNRFEENRYVVPTVDGAWWRWQGRPRTWSEWQAAGHDLTGTVELQALR